MIFSGYTVSVGVRYDLQIVTFVNFNDVIEKNGIRLSTYRKGQITGVDRPVKILVKVETAVYARGGHASQKQG